MNTKLSLTKNGVDKKSLLNQHSTIINIRHRGQTMSPTLCSEYAIGQESLQQHIFSLIKLTSIS
jgi:hypothetical protein